MMQNGRTILVVDDEEMIRSLARKILDRAGYPVVLAATGDESLALLRERPTDFGLALLDYTVEGLSGVDLMQAMRAVIPGLPIIVSTGEALLMDDLVADVRRHTGILLKPYTASDLIEAIRITLESTRSPH